MANNLGASTTPSKYFVYVVAYLVWDGAAHRTQIYRAYSHSEDAKAGARQVWKNKLNLSEEVWGPPDVVEPAIIKGAPQMVLSMKTSHERYKGRGKPYVRQQVVVEKVFMDNRGGGALRQA